MALTMTPLTTLIMSAVPLGKAGVGSAMNDTTRELGGALGVAVLGSLVTSSLHVVHRRCTSAASPRPTGRSPSPGWSVRSTWPTGSARAGAELVDAAKHAFMDGVHLAALTGAAVVVVAAVAAWKLLPRDLSPAEELAEELEPEDVDELLDDVLPVPVAT